MKALVVAIIATYRRAPQLSRLLDCLGKIGPSLGAVVVIDNGNDEATRGACEGRAVEVRYYAQQSNLGCGGGLRVGEEKAAELYRDRFTHLWILDDDAIVPGDGLDILLEAMESEGADAASPMLVDENGHVRWYAGLLDPEKFRAIRHAVTPDEYIAKSGASPVAFSWSTGISFLVTRRAVEDVGFHRSDFWIRGEDLEFSLRITARYKGIFVPRLCVQHVIPADTVPNAECVKQRAHLQNVSYTGFRLPHGRRIILTVPGNIYHFLREWHCAPTAFLHAFLAFWRGAILGQPAGATASKSAAASSPPPSSVPK
jgi:GT2 family glycosyltransferase